ncbi:RNA polymerase sigma-70 factor [uncultured Sanguibacteroides sp.]|uniref:RNA polymerase sigma-70 factor n=1 Tax=uncultured Sanguibacteroides sp. TaxID=1635151 RepID=UPI0025D61E90|nr:RNA polymerase sigma-70 factor [uncultured Sanguibacteroides sp.]
MDLFERIKAGDRVAFKTLFDLYYRDLLRVAVYYVRDLEVAKDIVQELYTKLWENRKALQKVENEQGYLRNSTRNRCLNYREHSLVVDKYQRSYVEEESEEESEELIQNVKRLLERLPEKRRKILELSIVESKSYAEIAQEQGVMVNTVKDHIRKAYAFIRENTSGEKLKSILFFLLQKKIKF